MPEKPQVKIIRDIITPWLKQDLQEFLDREPWGELDFTNLAETFEEQILPVFKDLIALPIERLYEGTLNAFQSEISSLNDQLATLDSFSVKDPEATRIHGEITSQVKERALAVYNRANANLPYLIAQTKPGSKAEKELARLETEFKASVKASKKAVGEVEALLAGVRTATAEKGVVGYTKFFDTEASDRDGASKLWLGIASVFAVAAGWLAWKLFSGDISPPELESKLDEGSRLTD